MILTLSCTLLEWVDLGHLEMSSCSMGWIVHSGPVLQIREDAIRMSRSAVCRAFAYYVHVENAC